MPEARVSQNIAEVASQITDPNAIVSQNVAEVGYTTDVKNTIVSFNMIEVAYRPNPENIVVTGTRVSRVDGDGDQEGIPGRSDRSAWDINDYADRHAKDIFDDFLIHHVPKPNPSIGGPGLAPAVAKNDGSEWIQGRLSIRELSDVDETEGVDGDLLIYRDIGGGNFHWTPETVNVGLPNASEIGDILLSVDGATFQVSQPIISDDYTWVVGDDDQFLVEG